MNASDIIDDVLDRTGTAMMSGNFDSFLRCFAMPYEITTFEGKQVLRTADDFRDLFYKVRRHYDSLGVTELVRQCVEASWDGPDRIKATHLTHLIRGSQLVQRPYPVFSEMSLQDGKWKLSRGDYAIVEAPLHSAVMTGRLPPEEPVQ